MSLNILDGLVADRPDDAPRVVDAVLAAAAEAGATDIHLQPGPAGLEVKFRVDGVLQTVAMAPAQVAGNVIARLKVLAGLLTYHTDRPQEGRIRWVPVGQVVSLPRQSRQMDNLPGGEAKVNRETEMRVCTYPTLHGERAVVRLFGGDGHYLRLDDLGLPVDVLHPLRRLLGETSGAILVSGPAGSGKTTSVYACLREMACAGRCLVSIEDPVEVAVDGVAQSQVHQPTGLDLATGLRFLMRQDPEVIMVGEIRDRATAEAAMQASLTGHLLLSTFHAGSAAETVGRLLDMGIEPYVLRSGLLAILNQRLLRRLCKCARPSDSPDDRLGLPVERVMLPQGCPACGGTGYRGRFLLVEMLPLSRTELARAILSRADTAAIERLAVEGGMLDRWHRASQAVADGLTSPAEARRVLGFSQ
ncbi:MAG: GspE/PulE family protein [Thermoguttaceae bacterium]